jgi:hypothetical protein
MMMMRIMTMMVMDDDGDDDDDDDDDDECSGPRSPRLCMLVQITCSCGEPNTTGVPVAGEPTVGSRYSCI